MIRTYKKVHYELANSGFKPATHSLDNEASEAIYTFYRQQSVAFQLVPPHMHKRNASERAIS